MKFFWSILGYNEFFDFQNYLKAGYKIHGGI
jgi:hypothetical protein